MTPTWNISPNTPLDEFAARWLSVTKHERDAKDTGRLYELHVRTHLTPFFETVGNVTKATVMSYIAERLSKVKRETVKKEVSTLRICMRWAAEAGYVDVSPEIPSPSKRARGTAFAVRRRGAATELTPEECRDVINQLPQWSTSKKVAPFAIRARFIVAHQTGLRPATLDALEVGRHYTRGECELRITDDIDKARFGRVVPLSEEACAALDTILPASGLIFGKHDYKQHLQKAARAVLPEEKAKTFAAYDFRHARITEVVETGNLTGAMHLAGHKQVGTTSRYTKPNKRAAERALKLVGPTGFDLPKPLRATQAATASVAMQAANMPAMPEARSLEVLARLLSWGFKSPPSH